jgi:hypothetical protein
MLFLLAWLLWQVVIMSATLGVRELAENPRLFPREGPRAVPTPPIIQVSCANTETYLYTTLVYVPPTVVCVACACVRRSGCEREDTERAPAVAAV